MQIYHPKVLCHWPNTNITENKKVYNMTLCFVENYSLNLVTQKANLFIKRCPDEAVMLSLKILSSYVRSYNFSLIVVSKNYLCIV